MVSISVPAPIDAPPTDMSCAVDDLLDALDDRSDALSLPGGCGALVAGRSLSVRFDELVAQHAEFATADERDAQRVRFVAERVATVASAG